jgi:hypothetical protein
MVFTKDIDKATSKLNRACSAGTVYRRSPSPSTAPTAARAPPRPRSRAWTTTRSCWKTWWSPPCRP